MKKQNNYSLTKFASAIFDSGILNDMQFHPKSIELARLCLIEGKTLDECADQMEIMHSSANGHFQKFMKTLPVLAKKLSEDRKKQLAELEIKNFYVASLKGILHRGNSFMNLVDQLKELEKHPEKMKKYAVKLVDVPDISVRLLNALREQKIYTVGDVFTYRKSDFDKFRRFGKNSIKELEGILTEMGIAWE